ncbi:MAG: nucleotide exchange factor GrpE [Chloroflexota bacterium]|nr:nucleotide exchange factor GrpE [Chloroflexota bacterium]
MTQPIQDPIQDEEQYRGAVESENAEAWAPAPDEDTGDDRVSETSAPEQTEPSIEAQLQTERERAQGYLEELQRERASFINFRRRTEQEKETWTRDANSALIFNVLPVIDDFERARDNIPTDQQDSAWVDGMMLVGRKLLSTLELAGLRPIEAVGKPFDPTVHEAVSVQPVEGQEAGIVLEEYRKGYKIGDRVLRPSMVKVSG